MPKNEWDNRIKKAKQLMNRDGLDALVIVHNKNLIYYFGAEKTYKYMFPTVGIISKDGEAISIRESLGANHLELQGYADRNVSYKGDEKAPTEFAPHGSDLAAAFIEEIGAENGKIGMEALTYQSPHPHAHGNSYLLLMWRPFARKI